MASPPGVALACITAARSVQVPARVRQMPSATLASGRSLVPFPSNVAASAGPAASEAPSAIAAPRRALPFLQNVDFMIPPCPGAGAFRDLTTPRGPLPPPPRRRARRRDDRRRGAEARDGAPPRDL